MFRKILMRCLYKTSVQGLVLDEINIQLLHIFQWALFSFTPRPLPDEGVSVWRSPVMQHRIEFVGLWCPPWQFSTRCRAHTPFVTTWSNEDGLLRLEAAVIHCDWRLQHYWRHMQPIHCPGPCTVACGRRSQVLLNQWSLGAARLDGHYTEYPRCSTLR